MFFQVSCYNMLTSWLIWSQGLFLWKKVFVKRGVHAFRKKGGASSWTQGIASANREACKRNSSGIRIAEAEYAANGGSDIRFVL